MTRLELLRRRYATAAQEPNETRMTDMFQATGFAKTEKASRYLQQVCKHWEHNLKVEFDAERGTILFPKDARGASWPADGKVTLDAGSEGLTIRLDASAQGQLDGLKGAIERHVDRFAFREGALVYEWS